MPPFPPRLPPLPPPMLIMLMPIIMLDDVLVLLAV